MWWMLPATLLIFWAARQLAMKIKHPICNPLVITVAILMPILIVSNTPYVEYAKNTKLLSYTLDYAIVALAFPLYEVIVEIRKYWRSVLLITSIASLSAMISGVVISFLFGAPDNITASLLPKSVTTPIAITIADSLGGLPSIAAFCVTLAGTFGAILAYPILHFMNIHNPLARGLSIGAISHAMGTARCMEMSVIEGGYSSLSLIMCSILTSIMAPFVYPAIRWLFYAF